MSFLSRNRSKSEPTSASSAIPGVVSIVDAIPRHQIAVQGQVTRMRSRPTNRQPSLAVTVSDDSGSVTAVWTGRRAIGGISLGRRVVIEGVAVRVGERLEFTNPTYTLLP
jgi:RecG-like helicase